jgi:hypothetical protein
MSITPTFIGLLPYQNGIIYYFFGLNNKRIWQKIFLYSAPEKFRESICIIAFALLIAHSTAKYGLNKKLRAVQERNSGFLHFFSKMSLSLPS